MKELFKMTETKRNGTKYSLVLQADEDGEMVLTVENLTGENTVSDSVTFGVETNDLLDLFIAAKVRNGLAKEIKKGSL